MAIKFTSVKCPECGAKTHIEEEEIRLFVLIVELRF